MKPYDWRVIAALDNELQRQAYVQLEHPTPERFAECRRLRETLDHWPALFAEARA